MMRMDMMRRRIADGVYVYYYNTTINRGGGLMLRVADLG